MKQEPIFVVGPNRSGTSLLYALLGSHPNISMVRRTDLWRYFHNRYGNLNHQKNFERCLTAMLRYKRITRLTPDPARIRREFWQGEPTYGRLFTLFHQHHAEMVGKPRWGDKSLHTEHHADQVFAEFPKAKVIQVIRDPRDRYASERRRYKASVGAATSKWRSSTKAAIRNMQHYPEHYLVVRYESLVSYPEETLHQICVFIDEVYSPAMLTMQGVPEHREQGGNSSYEQFKPGEISTRSIGRFREVVSKRDIAFIQLCAGELMTTFDYDLEPNQFSLSDGLSYYLNVLPTNLARMTYHLMLKEYRDGRGRSIPDRRITEDYVQQIRWQH